MKTTSLFAGFIATLFLSTNIYATACAVKPNVWSNNPESVTEKFKDKVSSLLYKSAKFKEASGEAGPVALFETIILTPEKAEDGKLNFITSDRASTIEFSPIAANSAMMDTGFDHLKGVLKVYQVEGQAKVSGTMGELFISKTFPAKLILIGKGNACEVVLSKWIFTIKVPPGDVNKKAIAKQKTDVDAQKLKDMPADGIILEGSGEFVSGAKLTSDI